MSLLQSVHQVGVHHGGIGTHVVHRSVHRQRCISGFQGPLLRVDVPVREDVLNDQFNTHSLPSLISFSFLPYFFLPLFVLIFLSPLFSSSFSHPSSHPSQFIFLESANPFFLHSSLLPHFLYFFPLLHLSFTVYLLSCYFSSLLFPQFFLHTSFSFQPYNCPPSFPSFLL